MQTSIPDVYAAGDVCDASWEHAHHWLQVTVIFFVGGGGGGGGRE